MKIFYTRKEELKVLQKFLEMVITSSTSQMVAMIGPRGVGKTTLVLKAFEQETVPVFYFLAEPTAGSTEIVSAWLSEICRVYDVRYPPAIDKPSDVVSYLMELSADRLCVCIIDACQKMTAAQKSFWTQLQRIWDTQKDQSQMLLVIIGSSRATVEEFFRQLSLPLYGRLSGLMTLKAFTTTEFVEIVQAEYPQFSPMDLLTVYAVTGGVAHYIEPLSVAMALTQRTLIEFLFSDRGSWLRSEGAIYLANEFRSDSPVNMQILRKVAAGKTRFSEMQDGIDVGISPYVSRLEQLHLLEKNLPFGATPGSRNTRYSVPDPYLRFWLTFVAPLTKRTLVEIRQWQRLVDETLADLPTYLARSLAAWHRQKLLESGRWIQVGAWWDKRGENEIDLVALDLDQKTLLVGEVKLDSKKYNPDKLEQKVEAFLSVHPQFKQLDVKLCGLFPDNVNYPRLTPKTCENRPG